MTIRRRAFLGTALATPAILPALAQTARYPERPIEIIVGFTAGGGTDLDARSYGRALEQRLGGTVVITNRPGAGGELALGAVARAKPDGHTLGTTNYPGLLTLPIERPAQFRMDDFAPIANLVTDPSAITAQAEGPFRRLQDVIDRARAAPESLTYASPGIGTDDHLQLVLLQNAAGIRLNHVVFQGDPQLRTAVLGRQVDLMGLNLGAVMAAPQGFRILAQAGATRSRFGPDIPTLRELGYPVEMASERGIVAPAGTPPAILARLREATAEIARDAEFVRTLESRFTEPAYEPGEAWFTRLRAQEADYRGLWQRSPWVQRG
ncbi:tripartite tricarboxylate transporter substrate binding protein [Belnapia sp. T6]|uniref:Tripartite tricarboxylate transporter substrate binding protein n=1 Tax=Belnapia mucosa TaxID=2804532 RepID=A0ABS1V7I2_9PROT|nr:tripartite tricarboxylate transporter substrate binding protein [Belnapia mucosa]MBL6457619.1 tripartite tricarboxylate transporter substrate binding protein [Belnapia mucosa]